MKLAQMPSRKKPFASPVRDAMNAATAMPRKPLTACCTVSRRTSRSTKSTAPAAMAAQIAAVSPATALATTKTTTGRPLSTSPRQPPIDSTSSGFGREPAGSGCASRRGHAPTGFSSYQGLKITLSPSCSATRPRATSARPGSMPAIRLRPSQTRCTEPEPS